MSRGLKVYLCWLDGRNVYIVATPTKKAAYEAIRKVRRCGSYKTWDRFTSVTGNSEQIAKATAEPGRVFIQKRDDTFVVAE